MWGRRRTAPTAVRRDVGRKAKKIPHVAILDYADAHGTAMAQALYRLRQHPESVEAMKEALLQYEVLGALLDELRGRQEAAV